MSDENKTTNQEAIIRVAFAQDSPRDSHEASQRLDLIDTVALRKTIHAGEGNMPLLHQYAKSRNRNLDRLIDYIHAISQKIQPDDFLNLTDQHNRNVFFMIMANYVSQSDADFTGFLALKSKIKECFGGQYEQSLELWSVIEYANKIYGKFSTRQMRRSVDRWVHGLALALLHFSRQNQHLQLTQISPVSSVNDSLYQANEDMSVLREKIYEQITKKNTLKGMRRVLQRRLRKSIRFLYQDLSSFKKIRSLNFQSALKPINDFLNGNKHDFLYYLIEHHRTYRSYRRKKMTNTKTVAQQFTHCFEVYDWISRNNHRISDESFNMSELRFKSQEPVLHALVKNYKQDLDSLFEFLKQPEMPPLDILDKQGKNIFFMIAAKQMYDLKKEWSIDNFLSLRNKIGEQFGREYSASLDVRSVLQYARKAYRGIPRRTILNSVGKYVKDQLKEIETSLQTEIIKTNETVIKNKNTFLIEQLLKPLLITNSLYHMRREFRKILRKWNACLYKDLKNCEEEKNLHHAFRLEALNEFFDKHSNLMECLVKHHRSSCGYRRNKLTKTENLLENFKKNYLILFEKTHAQVFNRLSSDDLDDYRGDSDDDSAWNSTDQFFGCDDSYQTSSQRSDSQTTSLAVDSADEYTGSGSQERSSLPFSSSRNPTFWHTPETPRIPKGLIFQKLTGTNGNCFFIAISLYEQNQNIQQLREKTVEYLENNKMDKDLQDSICFSYHDYESLKRKYENLEENFDEQTFNQNIVNWHIKNLRNDGGLAHMCDVQALSHVLQRPIVIVQENGFIQPVNSQVYNTGEPIFVYHSNHHYDGLTLKDGIDGKALLQRLLDNQSPRSESLTNSGPTHS